MQKCNSHRTFAPPGVLLGTGSLPRSLVLHRLTPFSPLVWDTTHTTHSARLSNRSPIVVQPIDDFLLVLLVGGRRPRRWLEEATLDARRLARDARRLARDSERRSRASSRLGHPLTPNAVYYPPVFFTRQCVKPLTTDVRQCYNNRAPDVRVHIHT